MLELFVFLSAVGYALLEVLDVVAFLRYRYRIDAYLAVNKRRGD